MRYFNASHGCDITSIKCAWLKEEDMKGRWMWKHTTVQKNINITNHHSNLHKSCSVNSTHTISHTAFHNLDQRWMRLQWNRVNMFVVQWENQSVSISSYCVIALSTMLKVGTGLSVTKKYKWMDRRKIHDQIINYCSCQMLVIDARLLRAWVGCYQHIDCTYCTVQVWSFNGE